MLHLNRLKSLVSLIDPSVRSDVTALDDDVKKLIADTLENVKAEEQALSEAGLLPAARVVLDRLGLPVPDNAFSDYQRAKQLAQAALDGHPVAQAGDVPAAPPAPQVTASEPETPLAPVEPAQTVDAPAAGTE